MQQIHAGGRHHVLTRGAGRPHVFRKLLEMRRSVTQIISGRVITTALLKQTSNTFKLDQNIILAATTNRVNLHSTIEFERVRNGTEYV